MNPKGSWNKSHHDHCAYVVSYILYHRNYNLCVRCVNEINGNFSQPGWKLFSSARSLDMAHTIDTSVAYATSSEGKGLRLFGESMEGVHTFSKFYSANSNDHEIYLC